MNISLLYKVGYKNSNMWKYEVFTVRGVRLLEEAKVIVKWRHPKATKLEFVETVEQRG